MSCQFIDSTGQQDDNKLQIISIKREGRWVLKFANRTGRQHHCAIEHLENRRLLAIIFSDDFEGDFPGPWVISSSGADVSSWGDNLAQAYSGSKSAFAADNGDDFRTVYDNDLNNAMQLQNVSLLGYLPIELSFNYWLNSETDFDFFYVKVRNQSGVWSTLLSETGNQRAAGWQKRNLDLSVFSGQSDLIISFEFVSDSSSVNVWPSGLWIDDVRLTAGETQFPTSIAPGSGERIWTNPFGDLTRNERISLGTELDIFAFNPDVTGAYTISTTQTLDTRLLIYDSAGLPMTPIIDSRFGGETTTQNFTPNHWYYIAVAGHGLAGNYTLQIHGPTPSIINVPTSFTAAVNATIDSPGEVDYFSMISPNSSVKLTLTARSSSIDAYIELYDSNPNLLRSANAAGPGAPEVLIHPSSDGVYYVVVADASRTSVGSYSLEFQFEPSESLGLPASVVPGSGERLWTDPFGHLNHDDLISFPSEVDLFAFNPAVAGAYTISTTQNIDTQMLIYDSDGLPITPIIDDTFGGETIVQDLSQDHWYYIAVAGHGDTGFYMLEISGPAPPVVNVPVSAPSYTASVNAAIDWGGELDYFSVTAPDATDKLTFTLTSSSIDGLVALYDSTGTLLQSVNATGGGTQEVLIYQSTPGQIYYVAIADASRTSTGSYSLQFDFRVGFPGFPSSITPSNAERIWTNPFGDVTRTNTITAPTEIDLFAFNPDVPGAYTIWTQNFDTQMLIYDTFGLPMTPVIDGSTGHFTVQFLIQNHWYFIAIAGHGDVGHYTLGINGPDPSIVNVPTNYSTTVSENIDWGGELDYYSVIPPSSSLKLTLTTTSALVDAYLEVYDASGTLLKSANATGPGAQEVLVFPSSPDQVYYVAIADASRTGTGLYFLQFEFTTSGDPPSFINTSSPSTWIKTNPVGDVITSGNITAADKYDLYAFMPDVIGDFVFTTSGSIDTQFRIYSGGGNAITNLIDIVGPGRIETITFSLFAHSWYYIAVGGHGDSTGGYTLSINGPSADITSIATPEPGFFGSRNDNLSFGGDRHFYQLTAPLNATTLSLRLTPLQNADTFLELYNIAGGLISSSNSGGDGGTDSLGGLQATAGATYIVAVSGALPTTTTAFRLDADFDPNVYSHIHGRVYVDRNSNGVADPGEPGIPGWALYVDLDDDGQYDPTEPRRITDANGNYAFDELGVGTYVVAQLPPGSWVQTSPGSSGNIKSSLPPEGETAPQTQDSGKLEGQYVLSGLKWPQSAPGANVRLTYSYSNLLDGGLPGGLTVAQLRAAIQEALALWARYAPLTFVEVPDIGPPPSDSPYTVAGAANLRFGYHGIDGTSGTLAHGHSPPPTSGDLAGDVHFDSGETWGLNTTGDVIDILEVAVHEIGHALGLSHETSATAIMNPLHGNYYDGLGTAFLFPDDIGGIHAIYGIRLPRSGTWAVTLKKSQTATGVDFANFPTSFTGTEGEDTFAIRLDPLDPSRLQIADSIGGDAQVVYTIDKTRVSQLHYDGLGGNDVIIIDSSSGDPKPAGGFTFNLGSGVDQMLLGGSQFTFNSDVASLGLDALELYGGASISLVGPQHFSAALKLTDGNATFNGPVLSTNQLQIQSGSWLDLGDNALIVNQGDLPKVFSDIQENRIRTTGQFSNRRLGAILNANPIRTSFAGETGLRGYEVLVLYTLTGDLNLDKTVSISDFIDLASNINKSGTWRDGDLNYDGLITVSDFIDLATNFNVSLAGSAQPSAAPQPAAETFITRHLKKHHRHPRRPKQIAPQPRLLRFELQS